MIKTWIVLFAFVQATVLHGTEKVGKAHQIAVPNGTISISVPKGWTLGYNEVCETIVFNPPKENKKRRARLAGESLFTMYKKRHLLSIITCQGLVSIDYKTRPGEKADWDELLEEWRTNPVLSKRYADGIERFTFKQAVKKNVDGVEVYIHESTYSRYAEFPTKGDEIINREGIVMIPLTDIYRTPIRLGAEEYLLSVDVTYFADKYYTQKRREEILHEVVNLFKSFSFRPSTSGPVSDATPR